MQQFIVTFSPHALFEAWLSSHEVQVEADSPEAAQTWAEQYAAFDLSLYEVAVSLK